MSALRCKLHAVFKTNTMQTARAVSTAVSTAAQDRTEVPQQPWLWGSGNTTKCEGIFFSSETSHWGPPLPRSQGNWGSLWWSILPKTPKLVVQHLHWLQAVWLCAVHPGLCWTMAPTDSGTGTCFSRVPVGGGLAHFLGFCFPVMLSGSLTLIGDSQGQQWQGEATPLSVFMKLQGCEHLKGEHKERGFDWRIVLCR